MKDHLSLMTTHFQQKVQHLNVIEPVTLSPDHIFMSNGPVFRDGYYCIEGIVFAVCASSVIYQMCNSAAGLNINTAILVTSTRDD